MFWPGTLTQATFGAGLTAEMQHVYSITKSQTAIIEFTRAMRDSTGNFPPLPGIFPDYKAPVVANKGGIRELCTMRWGMPSSQLAQMESAKKRAAKLDAKGKSYEFKELLRMEPDSGTTNIRNAGSKHWKRWLGVENRCVVPFTSFSEFNQAEGGDIWFALDDDRPLAVFAGIWTSSTSVRKVKEGETTNDLFGFLTTEPNNVVGPIHPKAMPVILTKPEEIEVWLSAPAEEVLKLQRPLPDGVLKVVAKGGKRTARAERRGSSHLRTARRVISNGRSANKFCSAAQIAFFRPRASELFLP